MDKCKEELIPWKSWNSLNLTSAILKIRNQSGEFNTWNYITHQYWVEETDPRTKDLPLVRDSRIMLTIMICYLIFVTKLGPYLMRNRKPFELRGLMLVYNTLMVLLNAYAFWEVIFITDFGKYFLKYDFPSKNDFSEKTMRTIDLGWFYFLTKFFDLFDTIFFVLRKKNNQITLLHLYHHTSVPVLGWVAIRLAPMAPPLFLFAMLNSMIHVIMYSYYALASFGPSIQKYLWWKKYITMIQMIQFGILITYGCVLATVQVGYPKIWFWIGFAQNPLFFLMFYDFYKNSYNRKPPAKKAI